MAVVAEQVAERGPAQGGRVLEVPGGWAGDVAVHDGVAWAAWVNCHDPELQFLQRVDRDWPLRWVRVTQLGERNGARPHRGVAYSSPVWVTLVR